MTENIERFSVGSTKTGNLQSRKLNEPQPGLLVAEEETLERLKSENAILRAALDAVNGSPERERSSINSSVFGYISSGPKLILSAANRFAPRFQLNEPEDTKYAHKADGFDDVLHVFHKEWLGIRAAAGSLPGQKLAISAKTKFSRADVKAFFSCLEAAKARRFVFHGMSENAAHLIHRMAEAGLSQQIYLVYHGNVSQWCYEPERKLAFEAIEILRRGDARRIHFLKKDHAMVEGHSFTPMLLNMSPIVSLRAFIGSHAAGSVLIPGTDDWRKNLFSNALGAAMSENVTSILHYAKNIQLPPPHSTKLKHANFVDRRSTLQLMALCRCTLNVSLVECHPMVNLESEAVGTPCLRGPLNLDALEDHAYVRLVSVSDPTSPFEIRDAVDRVAMVAAAEMEEMIMDYIKAINHVSITRYREFLEV